MRLNATNANKSKMLNRTNIVVRKSGTVENCGNKKILEISPEALLKSAVGL
jgi:hypothetical protein